MQEVKEYRHISELRGWDKNPRKIKEADFERLKKQIATLGQYKPIIITPDGEVLGGNMRLRAYRELGIERVWVSVVHPRNEKEKIAYALSDNDRAGYYDDDLLAGLFLDYPEFDWGNYAVDVAPPKPLDLFLHEDVSQDEVPGVPDGKPKSKFGEIYLLGRHRLMCGDGTNEEHVRLLFGGTLADMVFTDPPYGVSYGDKNDFLNTMDRGNRIQRNMANDAKPPGEMREFWVAAFKNMYTFTKAGGSYYCCGPHGGELTLAMMESLLSAGWQLKQTIVWAKNNHVLGRGDYHYQHEILFYGWKGGVKHRFYGGTGETTLWRHDRPLRNELHPTMKPVDLVARAVRNSSKKGDIVMDLFGGSGTTLIACEQLGRVCYMMEIDPVYCDVIRMRYGKLTGSADLWEDEKYEL